MPVHIVLFRSTVIELPPHRLEHAVAIAVRGHKAEFPMLVEICFNHLQDVSVLKRQSWSWHLYNRDHPVCNRDHKQDNRDPPGIRTWQRHSGQIGLCTFATEEWLIPIRPRVFWSYFLGHMILLWLSVCPFLGPFASLQPCSIQLQLSFVLFHPSAPHFPELAWLWSTCLAYCDECTTQHHACCTWSVTDLGTLKGKPPSLDPCGLQSWSFFLYNRDRGVYNRVCIMYNCDHSAKLTISVGNKISLWKLHFLLCHFPQHNLFVICVHFWKSFMCFLLTLEQKKQNLKKVILFIKWWQEVTSQGAK